MGRAERAKGARGENEYASLLAEALGQPIRRKLGQARDGGDDIEVGPFRIEVKRKQRRSDGTLVRRPLSPHLQAYDMLQMSSATSITHRITGIIWSVGLVFLVWWLVAAASGPAAFLIASILSKPFSLQ
jgi:hypothetical protein